MTVLKNTSVAASAVFALIAVASNAPAQYAANVTSYSPGTTPASGFTTAAAALGSPERLTGEGVFPGVVSPFNPPFLNSEIVSLGEGGQLTLRLSNYAIPQAGEPEIGVFENFGLIDVDFPNGKAGKPAGGFGPPDSALVEVSENGTSWVSLGNIVFDIPTNGYTDVTDPFSGAAGSVLADFQQPFTGSLAGFDGLKYFDAGGPDIVDLLAGSGGGKWLDISGTGLSQVGYIRFSLADDGNTGTNLNFEIDGVSVSHAALGAVIVPELGTATLALSVAAGFVVTCRRRRPHGVGSAHSPARRRARGLGSSSVRQ